MASFCRSTTSTFRIIFASLKDLDTTAYFAVALFVCIYKYVFLFPGEAFYGASS